MHNYITHNEADIRVLGSHRGKILAPMEQLLHLFGEPSRSRDKTTYHWTVKFLDGDSVITIYDFLSRNEGVEESEPAIWDVGSYENRIPIDELEELGLRVLSSPNTSI